MNSLCSYCINRVTVSITKNKMTFFNFVLFSIYEIKHTTCKVGLFLEH